MDAKASLDNHTHGITSPCPHNHQHTAAEEGQCNEGLTDTNQYSHWTI